jgi:hypothetical protein
MAKDLLGWAAEQPDWVKDCLRRIAIAADYSVEQADADCILDNVRAAARAASPVNGGVKSGHAAVQKPAT